MAGALFGIRDPMAIWSFQKAWYCVCPGNCRMFSEPYENYNPKRKLQSAAIFGWNRAVFKAKYPITAHIYYFSCGCMVQHLLRNNWEGNNTSSRDALYIIHRIWFYCANCPLSHVSKSRELQSINVIQAYFLHTVHKDQFQMDKRWMRKTKL